MIEPILPQTNTESGTPAPSGESPSGIPFGSLLAAIAGAGPLTDTAVAMLDERADHESADSQDPEQPPADAPSMDEEAAIGRMGVMALVVETVTRPFPTPLGQLLTTPPVEEGSAPEPKRHTTIDPSSRPVAEVPGKPTSPTIAVAEPVGDETIPVGGAPGEAKPEPPGAVHADRRPHDESLATPTLDEEPRAATIEAPKQSVEPVERPTEPVERITNAPTETAQPVDPVAIGQPFARRDRPTTPPGTGEADPTVEPGMIAEPSIGLAASSPAGASLTKPLGLDTAKAPAKERRPAAVSRATVAVAGDGGSGNSVALSTAPQRVAAEPPRRAPAPIAVAPEVHPRQPLELRVGRLGPAARATESTHEIRTAPGVGGPETGLDPRVALGSSSGPAPATSAAPSPQATRMVERIETWIRQSESAPPPRSITLRGGELNGLTIRLSHTASGLSIQLEGATGDDIPWMRQVVDQLTERRIDVAEFTEYDSDGERHPLWEEEEPNDRRRPEFDPFLEDQLA